jgi:hypothetical protein
MIGNIGHGLVPLSNLAADTTPEHGLQPNILISISGTFSNLPNGAIMNVNGNNLQASYGSGDGNDLTLVVVPYL